MDSESMKLSNSRSGAEAIPPSREGFARTCAQFLSSNSGIPVFDSEFEIAMPSTFVVNSSAREAEPVRDP